MRRTDGFTLLEALIAMALFGALLSSFALLIGQWVPQWRHGLGRLQRDEQVGVAVDRLIGDLQGAVPIAGLRGDRLIFVGQANSVIFARRNLQPNSGFGIELVRVDEVATENGLEIVRKRAQMPGGRPVDLDSIEFSDPVALLTGSLHVRFAYAGDDNTFQDAWSGGSALPKRIEVAFYDERDPSNRISTAAALRVTKPFSCAASAACAGARAGP
jgi:general secretion pathway protein J